MPNSPAQTITHGQQRDAPAPTQRDGPRRRTLGLCAHCHKAVDVGSEYVRLHRRAWHLDCALGASPAAERPPPD